MWLSVLSEFNLISIKLLKDSLKRYLEETSTDCWPLILAICRPVAWILIVRAGSDYLDKLGVQRCHRAIFVLLNTPKIVWLSNPTILAGNKVTDNLLIHGKISILDPLDHG